jgi:hypothetical protein
MSSVYDSRHLPKKAVDGVTVCPIGRDYLAHTKREHNPWIQIDLQQVFDVRSVLIYARQECCGMSQKHTTIK